MPRQKNESASRVLSITVSEQMYVVLSALAAKGLMGKNPAEVALYFLTKEVARLDEAGYLKTGKTSSKE